MPQIYHQPPTRAIATGALPDMQMPLTSYDHTAAHASPLPLTQAYHACPADLQAVARAAYVPPELGVSQCPNPCASPPYILKSRLLPPLSLLHLAVGKGRLMSVAQAFLHGHASAAASIVPPHVPPLDQ